MRDNGGLCEVENQLLSRFIKRYSLMVQHPLRVSLEERAFLTDHFRFDPQAKLHTLFVASLNDGCQSVWKFFRIDDPVTQRTTIIGAAEEPTVIEHETFNAQRCCLIHQCQDRRLINTEIERLPGIQLHGTSRTGGVLLCYEFASNHLMPLARQPVLSLTAMTEEKRRALILRARFKL